MEKLNRMADIFEKHIKMGHKKTLKDAKKDSKKSGESVKHEMSESREFEAAETEGRKK